MHRAGHRTCIWVQLYRLQPLTTLAQGFAIMGMLPGHYDTSGVQSALQLLQQGTHSMGTVYTPCIGYSGQP